jgi:hypothetical protein
MEQVDIQVQKEYHKGYDVNDPQYPEDALGRPNEKSSNYNTQDSNLGRDTLGKDRMKAKSGEEEKPGLSNTGLTIENLNTKAVFAKNEKSLKSMFPKQKVSLFEGENLLNEDQIREEVK